jgi:GNAT superfamily N-acetyltransferase
VTRVFLPASVFETREPRAERPEPIKWDPMSLPAGFTLRRASTGDLETLVAHRREMFRDMGYSDEVALNTMAEKFRPWLLEHMHSGNYHAWVACAPGGSIAAGAGLWLMDWPPHMIGQSAQRGNILNVYTVANFRRRGLARQLMQAALDWCRENHIDTVILHASPSGRRLYESMGFAPSNEMRLRR